MKRREQAPALRFCGVVIPPTNQNLKKRRMFKNFPFVVYKIEIFAENIGVGKIFL